MRLPKFLAVVLGVLSLGGLAACSPLRTFDALVPTDRGTARVAEAVAYGDGPRRRLDVYAPTASPAAGEGRPMLVFFYGGSWNSGDRRGYGFAGSAFAAQGFVTVIPDYRLYPEVQFPDFLADGAAAVAWARANAASFGGDPDRIVLAGHSAGAYIAAMLALDPAYLAAAGVPRAALRGWAGLAGPYDFLPLDVASTINTFGAAPDLAATQPVTYADAGDPPAFLATGGADETVAPRHTETLGRLLEAAGVPVETRVYPGIGHVGLMAAVAGPLRYRAPVLAEAGAFLRASVEP